MSMEVRSGQVEAGRGWIGGKRRAGGRNKCHRIVHSNLVEGTWYDTY